MYYLNKIVGWALSPLGIMFLGLGFAGLMSVVGKRRNDKIGPRLVAASKWIVGGILVLTWIMGCGITTRFIGVSLEKDWEVEGRPHGDISGLPDTDAIVVLGGGIGLHKKCGAPEMFGAADRVWQGAKLYKAGKAPVVAISGPEVMNSTAPLLRDFGVPEEVMRGFSEARNTEEESKMIYASLSSRGDGSKPRILLVTSAWHMSRSKLLFERAGFEVVPAPTDFEMNYVLEQPIRVEDFFPSADAFMRNSYAVKEWVGNIGYRLLRR